MFNRPVFLEDLKSNLSKTVRERMVQVGKSCRMWTVGDEKPLHFSHQKVFLVLDLCVETPMPKLARRSTFETRGWKFESSRARWLKPREAACFGNF